MTVDRGIKGEFEPMHPIKIIVWGLVALPVAEVAAFLLVASMTGLLTAFVLLILVSFLGILVLRQVGGGSVTRLRMAGGAAEFASVTLGRADLAQALGGVLLVIPGFITGLLGVIVVFPASRQCLLTAIRRLFSAGGRRSESQIVDLAPEEWQHLPSRKLPPRSRRPKH
jgi:UPF0716 protein FxsA